MNLPTPKEIGHALAALGNWRVLHVQEVLYPYKPFSASVMLALGFRESGLRNICGGATWDPVAEKWVQAYTDRGWLQLSAQIDREAKWLATVEGCPDGWWVPDADAPPVSALTERHVPRFSPALDFTRQTMHEDIQFAATHGVKEADWRRFAIAAHNAGPTGALNGYRAGDVDKYTAGGDYSAYVLAVAPLIHDWIVDPAHSHWVFHPR